MKFVIFGLTISSSWGNGHATIWRGLCRALRERGHQIIFYERDVPYYAVHRDLFDLPGGEQEVDCQGILPQYPWQVPQVLRLHSACSLSLYGRWLCEGAFWP